MNNPLLHQYHGFFRTQDLWAHAPSTAPTALLLPKQIPTPSIAQLQHWQTTLSPKLRIGRQAEHFLQYYLDQHPQIDSLYHSLQITTEEKQTLGEFDFLYYENQQQQWYHLEQCFKFYLYDVKAGNREYDQWIGAHRRDSLAQKLDKLLHHQFPLLHHPVAQSYLVDRNIPIDRVQPQLSYKAALFLPFGETFPSHNTLNPACLRGYWLDWATFLHQAPQHAHYYLPPKRHWAIAPELVNDWQSYEMILPVLEQALEAGQAPLCWLQRPDGQYAQWWLVPWG